MHTAPEAAELTRSRRNHWVSWVANHASARPEQAAFRFRGNTTTWRALDERATAFAHALRRRGVGPGDRVLLVTLNHPEFFECVIGVNALGALAVPVNFRLTPTEMAFIARDSDALAVVTEPALLETVRAMLGELEERPLLVCIGAASGCGALDYRELLREEPDGEALPDVPEDAPALILYTSGTTGHPKGAVLSHSNMVAQAVTCIRAMRYDRGGDVGFLASPVFHVAALGSVAPLLMLGETTVIHPLGAFDSTELLDAWERERVSSVFLVPVQWQAVCADPTLAGRELALRVICWGAAPASETLLRAMSERFPGCLVVAVFGQTEMSPITCVLDGDDAIRKLGSVGRPIPTIQARVVDDDMNDVATGEVGEIVYRGPTLMSGYWRNPEGTAEAFRGGWFHSGDLVRQDAEGFVWVVDRKKDMIISGGENIYCAEVENAIHAHPDVTEVAVIGRPDPRWDEVPVAVLVARAGAAPPTLDALEAFLSDRLARYKQPKDVVAVDALPRNAGGKVLKPVLRERFGR